MTTSTTTAATTTATWSGQSVNRTEDDRLLRAQGEFGDDTPISRLAHLFFVRSPYAHARIVSIDVSGAETVDGFLGALTPDEVDELTDKFGELQVAPADAEVDRCLASGGKVRFVGEPVVAVAAVSREAARDAAAAVVVEYDELVPLTSADQAVAADAPVIHEGIGHNVLHHGAWDFGDVDFAFQHAQNLIEVDELVCHRFSATPLECSVVTVDYDAGTDVFDIIGGCAMPQFTMLMMAGALRHPSSRIRIQSRDFGGSFGVKIGMYVPATAVALMARKLRRAVRWTETRSEHHQMGGHSNERTFRNVRLAVEDDGTVLGLSYECLDDIGAYSRYEPLGSVIWAQVANACYQLKHLRVDFTSVYTNKGPTHPVRGYSRLQHMWLVERMMDLAAHHLGFDPVTFRLHNYIQPDQYPYTTVNGCVYDSGDLPASLRQALELIDYDDARRLQAAAVGTGKRIGIGIGSTLDSGTNNFGQARLMNPYLPFGGNTEGGLVRMGVDGTVFATTGGVAFGQGHETTTAQVVADALGLRPEDIHVHRGGDSALSAQTGFSGSYASQFAVTGIGAILNATAKLSAEIRLVAGTVLGASPDEIVLEGGFAKVDGDPERMLPFGDVAGIVHFAPGSLPAEVADEVGLVGRAVYRAPFELPDVEHKTGNLTLTYATQIHACVLEIDEETGLVEVLRYAAVDDCGVPINPMIVQGQVFGATAHGLSAALFEHFGYNADGQLLAANFYDYHAATALDMPTIAYGNVVSPSPFTPTGAKGMGEGGGAPLHAVSAAVQDAIGRTGAILNSHASPEAVLDALAGAGADKVRVL
ncbi:xanthine dehydrogenase family protein molybdopterin-binding subunit [Aeromicrobium fastidiosum]|uniref:Xanthine dehydrogenase family protein n=1 Tax=Aeromicrobium fastidiosum TaxID=52699 RepID=A0A641AP29_9ACTN|nr:xanthine dehydrogenase family protein molybdopterin-binding subunit [Aeromicrobium fastidiosum]KAA1378147.1 xanthine dehydrogenase family protein [Aeromicrobium fastidiosum]MBP2389051.1 2-furoyl-CoA dehydrogenase large subunit [Aeromicrobium fastidiosum]